MRIYDGDKIYVFKKYGKVYFFFISFFVYMRIYNVEKFFECKNLRKFLLGFYILFNI